MTEHMWYILMFALLLYLPKILRGIDYMLMRWRRRHLRLLTTEEEE